MQLPSSVDTVAQSMYSAIHLDFSSYEQETRDFEKFSKLPEKKQQELRKENNFPMKVINVRPTEYHCEVFAMFSQTWGSTALGFGGIGGAAMTPAYTVVIYSSQTDEYAVYWNGKYAYTVNKNNNPLFMEFIDDLNKRFVANRRDCVNKYNAKINKYE